MNQNGAPMFRSFSIADRLASSSLSFSPLALSGLRTLAKLRSVSLLSKGSTMDPQWIGALWGLLACAGMLLFMLWMGGGRR